MSNASQKLSLLKVGGKRVARAALNTFWGVENKVCRGGFRVRFSTARMHISKRHTKIAAFAEMLFTIQSYLMPSTSKSTAIYYFICTEVGLLYTWMPVSDHRLAKNNII